jgi:cysteine desulfurase
VPGIVGFGKSCEIAEREMKEEAVRVSALRDQFKKGIFSQISEVLENGDAPLKLPGTLNLSFAFVEGETALSEINKKVAVSSGSACSSAVVETSYVLKAMGLSPALAHTAIRFSLGRFTTTKEVEEAVKHVVKVIQRLRASSSLHEMMKGSLEVKNYDSFNSQRDSRSKTSA